MHESEKWKVKVKSLSRVLPSATPWTIAYQAPPSMGFSGKSTGVGCHPTVLVNFNVTNQNLHIAHENITSVFWLFKVIENHLNFWELHSHLLPWDIIPKSNELGEIPKPQLNPKDSRVFTVSYKRHFHGQEERRGGNGLLLIKGFPFLIKGFTLNKRLCVPVKSLQLCPILCDPMNCSPPGSSVHRILQARILEWVAMPFSRGSSRPRDPTHVSCTGGQVLYHWSHLGSLTEGFTLN